MKEGVSKPLPNSHKHTMHVGIVLRVEVYIHMLTGMSRMRIYYLQDTNIIFRWCWFRLLPLFL